MDMLSRIIVNHDKENQMDMNCICARSTSRIVNLIFAWQIACAGVFPAGCRVSILPPR
jgi:hypothetical protein